MRRNFRGVPLAICVLSLAAGPDRAPAQPAAKLSREHMEQFLKTARIVQRRGVSIGVTGTLRARLSDGTITHDAQIQSIDMSRTNYQTDRGTEINFRDCWKYNVAAYRIDKLLDLNMIPVSVERTVPGIGKAAVTWWIDDVMMDEVTRRAKKLEPPDLESWNSQMYDIRTFDQLIYNVDRNLQNLIITKDWQLWMIDHTRAFRVYKQLKEPRALVKCDRKLLEALRRLDAGSLRHEVKDYLTSAEIDGVLARRNIIVNFFDGEVARRGKETVLFDLTRP